MYASYEVLLSAIYMYQGIDYTECAYAKCPILRYIEQFYTHTCKTANFENLYFLFLFPYELKDISLLQIKVPLS